MGQMQQSVKTEGETRKIINSVETCMDGTQSHSATPMNTSTCRKSGSKKMK